MTPDPKLIELVARAMYEAWDCPGSWASAKAHEKAGYLMGAQVALTAINDSGEWWVAPAEPTDAMIEASGFVRGPGFTEVDRGAAKGIWDDMRTAYLSRTEETMK